MKIVINKCYGGYGLSNEAIELYLTKKNIPIVIDPRSDSYFRYYVVGENNTFTDHNIRRHDPILVEVVEELKEKANGRHAKLEIIEIPDGCHYQIDEYDGMESYPEIWIEVTSLELREGLSEDKVQLASQGCSIKLVDYYEL